MPVEEGEEPRTRWRIELMFQVISSLRLPPGRTARRMATGSRSICPLLLSLMDAAHHVEALDHPAEGGEALAVRVAAAAEVELGLVPDAV